MADEDGLYLENLDEFINDEDRIVTYKWLSRTLSVSSNQSKQMLFAYLRKQREDKNTNNISATYLVGGRCKVDEQMVQQYILTSDDNLDDTKSHLDVVTSVHIYSLQKSKPKDSNAFYTVDYTIHQEHNAESNRWSHIYCKEAKPLSDGGASRGHSKGTSGKENAEPSIPTGSSNSIESDKPKTTNQKSKKGQLPNMGMFAVKTEKKTPVEKEETKRPQPSNDKPTDSEKKQKTTKSSNKPKPAGGMLSFFGKQISAPPQKIPENKEEKTKENSPENLKDKTPEKTKVAKMVPEKTKEAKKIPENKPKERKKTHKQNRRRIKTLDSSDEEEDPIPKKCTILVSDSESNSEEDIQPKKSNTKMKKDKKQEEVQNKKKNSNKKEKVTKDTKQEEKQDKPTKTNRKRKKELKEESSEEESPVRSKVNCTVVSETPIADQHSTGNPTKRRKRRKVMRSKTYVDDDGFMVTEKVYESESTDVSDEEETLLKQEKGRTTSQAKKTSPESSKPKKVTELKPAKQASLMSFFKKN